MLMQLQKSGLPLARSAAPLAGTGDPKGGGGDLQSWNFDDDDFHPSNKSPFGGSDSFNGSPIKSKEKEPRTKTPRQWKWPWKKESQLTGQRVVVLNNSAANVEFSSNFVSTSKYNLATFLPKFLFEQFWKYADMFFPFTACIQNLPDVSPTNRWATIAPLAMVLLPLSRKFKRTWFASFPHIVLTLDSRQDFISIIIVNQCEFFSAYFAVFSPFPSCDDRYLLRD
ncbi:hypothetical protein IW261DRAFT_1564700 [Armillaria novae-zelandiae]|uniref:P-type ATPase N-terminal domain-containing protein n=1 Tax=Armillaria novae-zelandiae TaxID=153914 RepID=A0AA39P827_9AGAR|nr:hypothetical protein IW261DRAFT_1564700 [Armillaria novae-zelandiae]